MFGDGGFGRADRLPGRDSGMNFRTAILVTTAAGSIAGVLAVWGYRRVLRWRRKDPNELERLRRLDVNRRGRITSAEIVNFLEPESTAAGTGRSCLIVYKYEVAGVTYEVSQDVSALSGILPGDALANPTASVKYDPKTPTNSIIACEEWSGFGG
jgi:hypothetical protein